MKSRAEGKKIEDRKLETLTNKVSRSQGTRSDAASLPGFLRHVTFVAAGTIYRWKNRPFQMSDRWTDISNLQAEHAKSSSPINLIAV